MSRQVKSWQGQVNSRQVKSGQVEAGQVEAGQVEAGQVEAGQVQAGQVQAEQDRKGQVLIGEVRTGQCYYFWELSFIPSLQFFLIHKYYNLRCFGENFVMMQKMDMMF